MANKYTKQITIEIDVEDDSKLTNNELDNAFEAVARIIQAEVKENSAFMDAAQENIVNAEVTSLSIISVYDLLKG